jgi:hypothetical protein
MPEVSLGREGLQQAFYDVLEEIVRTKLGQTSAFVKVDELVQPNITCFCIVDDYLYVGATTTYGPSDIIKIDLSDFSIVEILHLSATDFIKGLVYVDGYLYAIGWGTSELTKIDVSTFKEVASITLTGPPNCLVASGGYLYAGLDTSPGKIEQIRLDTFTSSNVLTLQTGEDVVTSLVIGSPFYLYAGLGTSPGKVVLVSIPSMARTGVITFDTGENIVKSLAVDHWPRYIYAGLGTSPGKIVKIDTLQNGKVSTLTLRENVVWSLVMDKSDTYLYAGLTGYVAKIDLSTFTEITSIFTGLNPEVVPPSPGIIHACALHNNYLYAGGENFKVVKIALSNLQFDTIKQIDFVKNAHIAGTVTTEDTGANTNPERYLHEHHWESGEVEITASGAGGQKNLGDPVPSGKKRRIRELTIRHAGTNNTVVTLLVSGGVTKLTIDVPAQSTRVWSSQDGREFDAGEQPAVQSSDTTGGYTYVSASGVEA